MASILSFPVRQAPKPRRAEGPAAAASSVIIFPGVRYERTGEATDERVAGEARTEPTGGPVHH